MKILNFLFLFLFLPFFAFGADFTFGTCSGTISIGYNESYGGEVATIRVNENCDNQQINNSFYFTNYENASYDFELDVSCNYVGYWLNEPQNWVADTDYLCPLATIYGSNCGGVCQTSQFNDFDGIYRIDSWDSQNYSNFLYRNYGYCDSFPDALLCQSPPATSSLAITATAILIPHLIQGIQTPDYKLFLLVFFGIVLMLAIFYFLWKKFIKTSR